ncbi:MAG: metallophosphoesterase family protein [Solirubrobacterales bacterium]
MLVAVLSDTHLPKGSRRLPQRCVEAIGDADAVIHAGDFSTVAVLREIEAIGTPLHAVHGNVDDADLRRLLPASLELELAGRTIAVVHDAGPASGRLARLRARFPAADAVVFGHSHLPLHERDGELQIFNPGSPTERRRAPRRSFGILDLGAGGIRFRHLWLDS